MTYDEIMQAIKSGLTGDFKTDIRYLNRKCEEYAKCDFGVEISRACGRMIYELMPKEEKEKFKSAYDQDLSGLNAALEETQRLISERKTSQALEIIEPQIKKFRPVFSIHEDQVSVFVQFDNTLEECIYKTLCQSEKEIRPPMADWGMLCFFYGFILMEKHRYEEAENILREAHAWKPLDWGIASEYTEVFKVTGRLKEFRQSTLEMMSYAYAPAALARGFRNLGYYDVEMEDYHAAAALFQMSMIYEPNHPQALGEMQYIMRRAGKMIYCSDEEISRVLSEKGLSQFPQGEILRVMWELGTEAFRREQFVPAREILRLLYEITEDEEVKKLLDSIPVQK